MRRVALLLAVLTAAVCAQDAGPQPREVTPGAGAGPPSDAVVLFDGTGTSHWVHSDGAPAKWPVIDGALTCKSGTGDLYSKEPVADAQIHIEFATPNMPEAHGQARGNSGVYLQGRYEIQVLDSYRNPTYSNGSAGALYGQYAPLVNASLPPEQWQTYDIVFHPPKCDAAGQVTAPGTLTLVHNGVLVQDHVRIKGPTNGAAPESVCQPGPLLLQDHFHPDVKETFMKFRNIWFRPLSHSR